MLKTILVLTAAFCVQSQAGIHSRNQGIHSEGSSCQVSSNEVGVCSFLKNCEAYLTKRVRYSDLKRCAFIKADELICCPTVTVSSTTTLRPVVSFDYNFDETETSFQEEPKRRPAKIACDVFSETIPDRITSRVFGQRRAMTGEFPHIGAMLYNSYPTYEILCEATLISDRFALTAAVCVDTTLPTLVRFGLVKFNQTKKESHHVDARIKTVFKHREYRRGSPLHDIAVIEFTEEVPFSPLVSPACLRTDTTDIPSSVGLQVAGWNKVNTSPSGRQSDSNKRAKSDFLLSANLTTIELSSCMNGYRNYLAFKKFLGSDEEGLYCAMDSSKYFTTETCYGDPGGPLMRDTEELWEIIGVASYVNSCGVRLPNVFARVSHYLDWIEEIVWSAKSRLTKVSYIGI